MLRPRRLSAAVAAILLLTCVNAAAAQPGKSTDELIKEIVENTPKARAPTDNAIMQMVNEAQKKASAWLLEHKL